MRLLIIDRYKIVCKGKISYNRPAYGELNDWHTENVKHQKTLYGADVIKFFTNLLQFDDLWEFCIEDNKVYLDYFNPGTGESSSYSYIITSVPEKK